MIEVDWGNVDETLIIWTFYKHWTADDFIHAFDVSENMIMKKAKREPIHFMLDIQHTAHLPPDMFTLGRYGIKRATIANQKGLLIIINASQLWHHLYEMIQVTIPHDLHIHFAKDANKAYDLINHNNTWIL